MDIDQFTTDFADLRAGRSWFAPATTVLVPIAPPGKCDVGW